jgi:hypothetical protein
MISLRLAVAATMSLLAVGASAQNGAAPEKPSAVRSTAEGAGRIASQPAKDVGAVKTSIPPVLAGARADPYGIKGYSCAQLAQAITELNAVLGPDFVAGPAGKENRAGKLAQAGGQTVVNSLIPFRGLVREVTGAAPAQRRLNAAIDAGYARRGFLRGVHLMRKCKSKY